MVPLSGKQQLQKIIEQIEWATDRRVEQPWQIDYLRQVMVGKKRESAPIVTPQNHRPAK